MSTISVKLHGAEQFNRLSQRLKHLPREVFTTLNQAMLDEAARLDAAANKKAPWDTGDLVRSYSDKVVSNSISAISVTASYSVPYAIHPHEKQRWSKGTKKGTPGAAYPHRAWFEKAARAVGKGTIGRVIRKLRPVLKRIYGWK